MVVEFFFNPFSGQALIEASMSVECTYISLFLSQAVSSPDQLYFMSLLLIEFSTVQNINHANQINLAVLHVIDSIPYCNSFP